MNEAKRTAALRAAEYRIAARLVRVVLRVLSDPQVLSVVNMQAQELEETAARWERDA